MQHHTQTIKFQCGPIKEVGSTGADALYGGEGNDTLLGNSNQLLYAGDGNDTMEAATSGNLYGEAGEDLLMATIGGSTLYGGEGNDTLLCGTVADILYSDDGADSMDGGDENAIALTKLEETLMQHQRTRNRLMHGALSALHQ